MKSNKLVIDSVLCECYREISFSHSYYFNLVFEEIEQLMNTSDFYRSYLKVGIMWDGYIRTL